MPTGCGARVAAALGLGRFEALLASLDETGREAAWQEIEQELRAFESKAGFEGPCEMIVAVGVK